MTAKLKSTQVRLILPSSQGVTKGKDVEFIEYNIDGDKICGLLWQSEPTVDILYLKFFINDQLVGGCDDLYELDNLGKLL